LEKFGFPTPDNVPTELEEAMSLWMQPDVMARHGQLLDGLIVTHPNNDEQQMAFDSIMNSIIDVENANRDDITEHVIHQRNIFFGHLQGRRGGQSRRQQRQK